MGSVIIVHSWHHGNTRKVADSMAEVLSAEVKNVIDVKTDEPERHEFFGFGAGIDSGRHYKELLEYAESLPPSNGKKCFIFSTAGVYTKEKMMKDHRALHDLLLKKGYEIVGDFACRGFNTNSFLKRFGGMNKGHPTKEDLADAKKFAERMNLK